MEKEFSYIDNEGKVSNDTNQFLQDYERYRRDNPEKARYLDELKQVGVFRKAFSDFYFAFALEIQNNAGDKEFLIQQKKNTNSLIHFSKARITYNPNNKKANADYNFVIASMESLLNDIETYLSNLESKIPKNSKANEVSSIRILAFDNNIMECLDEIKIILESINNLLFDNSTIDQWECLLNGKNLNNSIIIKNGVTIKDFKYFIKKLQEDCKILKGSIYRVLESINAFLWKGDLLKAEQIRKVENTTHPKLKPQIDELLSILL